MSDIFQVLDLGRARDVQRHAHYWANMFNGASDVGGPSSGIGNCWPLQTSKDVIKSQFGTVGRPIVNTLSMLIQELINNKYSCNN